MIKPIKSSEEAFLPKKQNSRYKNPDDDPRGPYCAVDFTAPGERRDLIYLWKGILPPRGRHWQVDQEKANSLDAEGQVIWPSRGGRPRRKRYLADLLNNTEELIRSDISRPELLLRTTMRALAEEVARIPDTLRHIEWRDLERILREVLEGLGFETTLTRPGRDGGFDLELRCDEDGQKATYLVEVKHWTNPAKPGRNMIARFIDVVVNHSANGGLFLSSSGFTRDVLHGYSEIERHIVRLGDKNKIVSLCQNYIMNKGRIFLAENELPLVLFNSTF